MDQVNMRIPRPLLVPVVLLVLAGCTPKRTQYQAEGRTALDIITFLKVYELRHPEMRPTNLFQVFVGVNKHYPHFLHDRFVPFGVQAGFTNSFYEKYVFPAPGVTNRLIKGEVLLLNAEPYRDGYGDLVREVISKTSDGYQRNTLSERTVQELFKEASAKIPDPTPMPAPPTAPAADRYEDDAARRTSRFFVRLAEYLGLDGRTGWILQYATLGLGIVAIAALLVWSRPFSRRH
jgi:hypothetical protein